MHVDDYDSSGMSFQDILSINYADPPATTAAASPDTCTDSAHQCAPWSRLLVRICGFYGNGRPVRRIRTAADEYRRRR